MSNETTPEQYWARLTQHQQAKLSSKIQVLFDASGTRLSDKTLKFWCMALAKYATGAMVFRALEQCSEEGTRPSIAKVKTLMRGRPELEEYKPPPKLTESQCKRSEQAAIMSMLWLHYEHGWKLTDFAGHILGRLFGRDPTEALKAAAEMYDRATLARWMEDQKLVPDVPVRNPEVPSVRDEDLPF